jgi:hypothetical protein
MASNDTHVLCLQRSGTAALSNKAAPNRDICNQGNPETRTPTGCTKFGLNIAGMLRQSCHQVRPRLKKSNGNTVFPETYIT